jgi:hypothetical protein
VINPVLCSIRSQGKFLYLGCVYVVALAKEYAEASSGEKGVGRLWVNMVVGKMLILGTLEAL